MKKCFKCGKVKKLTSFYKHDRMIDGRLGKCKTCTKTDVKKNYRVNRDHYVEYERLRFKEPKRKQDLMRYQHNRRKKYPGKDKARQWVSNAVRDGRLRRLPCEVCREEKSQAHHKDYRRYYDVTWLCFKCHRETHGQTAIVH